MSLPIFDTECQQWMTALGRINWATNTFSDKEHAHINCRPSPFFSGGITRPPVEPFLRTHPIDSRLVSIDCNYFGCPNAGQRMKRLICTNIDNDEELSVALIKNSLKFKNTTFLPHTALKLHSL